MPTSVARAKTALDVQSLRHSCARCSLRQLCLPAGVGAEDLLALEDIVERQKPFDKGCFLFRVGDGFENLVVIRSGTVKTFYQGTDGEDQIIGFHFPGDLIGLDAIHDEQHGCTAQTLERTTVCSFPFSDLQEVAAKIPALRKQFMRIISREILSDQGHLLALNRKTAQQRLSVFLSSVAQRFSQRGFSASDFNLSMSRYDLANYLGLAVETVSRLFSGFHAHGILEVERRHVRILDADRLNALCHDNAD